jgi:hypothetical protein
MTRKDYVLLANSLGFALENAKQHNFDTTSIYFAIGVLSGDLKAENPRFDHAKFIAAIEKRAGVLV